MIVIPMVPSLDWIHAHQSRAIVTASHTRRDAVVMTAKMAPLIWTAPRYSAARIVVAMWVAHGTVSATRLMGNASVILELLDVPVLSR